MPETLDYRIHKFPDNAPTDTREIILNNGITLGLRSRKADEPHSELDEYEQLVMLLLETEEGLSVACAAARSGDIELLPIVDVQAEAQLNWFSAISAQTVVDTSGMMRLYVKLHYDEL
jgi:hypothetical protein